MALDHYRSLGRSGLAVSPFCLGAMTFGEDWGFGSDAATATRILDLYIERGGNFVDTANLYTKGNSERIIGEHLAGDPAKRQRLVLATKFSANMVPGDPNAGGASRKAIIAQCEASLGRLQTDYIDLYWQHWEDPFTPVEETMQALNDLVRAGKVLHIGISDTAAWKVAAAQLTAHFRGWAPLIALQIEYSLLERTVEGDLVPMALDMGLGITPWSPLRGGLLSGKYGRDSKTADSAGRQATLDRNSSDQAFAVVDVLKEVAGEMGTSPARVALAWLLTRPGVVSPIIGARKIEQLEDNLAALDVELPEEAIARLDAASRPHLNFPSRFLEEAQKASFPGLTVNARSFGRSVRS